MKKKILAILILFLTIVACVSCKEPTTNPNITQESSNQLQIFKSDLKLTQDQVISQIKAEHIKENQGYVDSDEIVVLISLEGESLIESYNNDYSTKYQSVSDYLLSSEGQKQIDKIKVAQETLINQLTMNEMIKSVEYSYDTVINAIAVNITYGNFKKLSTFSNIKQTIISDTYNLPQSTSADVSAITNLVDVYETGIFNSSTVNYTGAGTVVAILDSGFDCSHQVFNNVPERAKFSQSYIEDHIESTKAYQMSGSLATSDVYYSEKIPFVYDYADGDPDVFPYDSDHGTHVAGIIGGKDDNITGVAINTQLVLMKVFPDLSDGADYDDILAALEDAVELNVDAINMSLGSSCGFAREEDGNAINAIYDAINESGISLITAASNSYSSGFGGEQGNTSFVTNPDSGTVGSPSTYEAALSVASISGVKSHYMIGNGSQVVFFKESNAITGDENSFIEELISSGHLQEGETKEFEYVTIPGVGLRVNYTSLGDITGKIALVRRGDNTFEEKAQNAKNAGAIACIIYNNIEGDITMSMGKSDHIPTISISKDDGTLLAIKDSGTLTISSQNQAGPFMSDFSSWGPLPSLHLKPEITAHGGNITSSVPGGGYDQISGTSMASPNLCGIVILIRQYLIEKYPTYSTKEISIMTNQLLMSTATIVLNEEGNPYSPRKQGAGLASLYNAVNTLAYITVDGIDRTKLELFDDPKRNGTYEMEFNIKNIGITAQTYDLSVVGMTESVSTSDEDHVAEKGQLLNGATKVEVISGGTLSGTKITVNGDQSAKVKITYTLSDEDKNTIDSLFPYGMYVEGYVKLDSAEGIDLNVPFLAFYGDWTEAPMFDKTYYEVESEAHNGAIDDDDKIKADYYATTPYGSYFYNYIIPLGTYLYDVDEAKYDVIPASLDRISISNILGTIDGISAVYAGLLRNAKTVTYEIKDKVTGEIVYSLIDYNASKAYSLGASPYPYYNYLRLRSNDIGLINNHQYEFSMQALLDYGDGGINTNVRNTFSFDFYLDDEAPTLRDVTYEKVYDRTLKKDRYYVTLDVYDNHYVQSITPILFTSSSSYSFLTENPIPVYGEKGETTSVRFEITDYIDNICEDALVTSALAFSIDDYALNSNIYICQLPGTKGDFKFTKNGEMDGTELIILSMYEDEIVDLTQYLATADETVDDEKAYLKYLSWTSSNEKVATISEGLIKGISQGRTTVVVTEAVDLQKAVIIINVKAREESKQSVKRSNYQPLDSIDSLRFSHFDTLFAYSRAAQTSEIGETGDRTFISSVSSLSFYPGEKIQLFYDFNPWYLEDNYNLTYTSTNTDVAIVDEEGIVTGLKEGNANIVLSVEGSNITASIRLTIKSEFIIEDRTLIAYKGLGGEVVIPDDEGILYIGSYAFCLYDTDRTIELTEEDYDANKIPSMNTTVTSVVIPEGVEEIQRYAFYNCIGLESVEIPSSVKYVREYAFYNDGKLKDIDLKNVLLIGREAFRGCVDLQTVDLTKAYTIGIRAFEKCTSLETVDLSALRNTGREVFKDCTALTEVTLTKDTKLSYAMFVNSGLIEIDIYEEKQIPDFCFAQCENLATVNIHNDLLAIGLGAFSECPSLVNFNINKTLQTIGEQAFYQATALMQFTLPNNEVTLGNYCFYMCSSLEEIIFLENTKIVKIEGSIFQDTNLQKFTVDQNNQYYQADNELLVDKDGKTIIFGAVAKQYGDYTIDAKYEKVNDGAFSGVDIKTLTILNKDLSIGDYAFANCENLTKITFPSEEGITIGNHAFNYTSSLEEIVNLVNVKKVGDYAFANSKVATVVIGESAKYGEGAFFRSQVKEVTIGKNTSFGLGAFQECTSLTNVNMPTEGTVSFGVACFARDISLANIDLSTLTKVEDQTFYGCTSLKAANLQNAISIGEYAFADCGSLNSAIFPRVVEIKEGAFARYETNGSAPIMGSIDLPNTLLFIGDGAFLGCNGLTEVTLPSSIEEAGDYLFAFCMILRKVVLPQQLTRVGQYWFAGCEELTDINLEHVKEIDDYAFTSSILLQDVNLSSVEVIGVGSFASTSLNGNIIANNLREVYDFAFQGTSLQSFTAPNLRHIGDAAFQNNRQLERFVFSQKLYSIGDYVFQGCTNLKRFYYYDGDTEKDTGIINEYAQLEEGVLYTKMKSGSLQLTSIPSALDVAVLEVLEGTKRIDTYAGNDNPFINKIVLPDTLKLIGNYAFYNFEGLNTVEFKSFIAPALEDYYISTAELVETDPGYDKLHAHMNLFGYEAYYYTFIDLVGKKEPINMILPANEGIEGYDSLIYEVYFGMFDEAERSTYIAMDKYLDKFIELATKILEIDVVKLSDEQLITDALTAYNNTRQIGVSYGLKVAEWNQLVDATNEAKASLTAIKLSNASQTVQQLQQDINNLPLIFDISKLSLCQETLARINALTFEERALLDLSTYNQLMASYNSYISGLASEVAPIVTNVTNSLIYTGIIATLISGLGFITFFTKKRR